MTKKKYGIKLTGFSIIALNLQASFKSLKGYLRIRGIKLKNPNLKISAKMSLLFAKKHLNLNKFSFLMLTV